MFQLGVRIREGVALKFSDIEYGKNSNSKDGGKDACL